MSLAKLLSRQKGGVPSIVTAIDKSILQTQKEIFSKRQMMASLNRLRDALNEDSDEQTITDLFNNFVDAFTKQRSRKDFFIHVSELYGACPRALYYKLSEVEPTNESVPHDPKTYRTFDVGTFYHAYLQKFLRKSGILTEGEALVLNKKIRLKGHTDGILTINGERYILEIKTINSYGYQKIVRNNMPYDYHIWQASVYAKELGIKKIIFLYVNKDTSDMKEFLVTENSFATYQGEAYHKIALVNKAVDTQKPPKRWCKTAFDQTALGCVFCNHCFDL